MARQPSVATATPDRPKALRPFLVPDQRNDLMVTELGAPLEERQLDDEAEPDHVATQLLHQPDCGCCCSPCRYHVVDDEGPLPFGDAVTVDFEEVGAVLEDVLLLLHLPRQLARLADGH